MSDPDTLVAVIGEALAKVKAVEHQPKRFRIHPLDVQTLEKRFPVGPTASYSLSESINKLLGVPVQWDCGVPRGQPEVDYE
jgi:hypothetical protein